VAALAHILDRFLVNRGPEAFLGDVFPEGHIHLVALGLHDELAGNVTQPAGRTGKCDIRQIFVDSNTAFNKGKRHDVLA
jgi:hypothetical protein